MKKLVLIAIVFILYFNFSGLAQLSVEWSVATCPVESNGFSQYAELDQQGNIYQTFLKEGAGVPTVTVVKYNAAGSLVWSRSYVNTTVQSLILTNSKIDNGNCYLLMDGRFSDGDSLKVILAKIDSTGHFAWEVEYSPTNENEKSCAMDIDHINHEVVIAAAKQEGPYSFKGIYLIKYSASGSLLWQNTPAVHSFASEILIDPQSNIHLAATRFLAGAFRMIYYRYNSAGALADSFLYVSQYFSTFDNQGNHQSCMGMDSDNHIYLLGIEYPPANQSLILMKFDTSGNHLATDTIILNTINFDRWQFELNSLTKNIYIATSTAYDDQHFYCLNSSGNQLWNLSFSDYREFRDVEIKDDGTTYLMRNNENPSLMITAISATGIPMYTDTIWNSGLTQYINGDLIHVPGSNVLYIATDSVIAGTNSNTFLIKLQENIVSAVQNEMLTQQQATLYPSLTNNFVFIDAGNVSGPIYVFTTEGRLVKELPMSKGKVSIDVSGLPSGIYFARCFSGEGIFTGKFIKQ